MAYKSTTGYKDTLTRVFQLKESLVPVDLVISIRL